MLNLADESRHVDLVTDFDRRLARREDYDPAQILDQVPSDEAKAVLLRDMLMVAASRLRDAESVFDRYHALMMEFWNTEDKLVTFLRDCYRFLLTDGIRVSIESFERFGVSPDVLQLRGWHETLQAFDRHYLGERLACDGQATVGQSPRFVLKERIGEGGFGVVYRAFDERRQHDVAIKHIGCFRAGETIDRMFDEFRVVSRLAHDHVIAMHDAFMADGDAGGVYVVMQLAEGDVSRLARRPPRSPDVRDIVEQYGPWHLFDGRDVDQILFTVLIVAQTLEEVHAKTGVLHCDIKPQNILINAHNRPLLADFGLSRNIADTTSHGAMSFAGTWAFASPEQRAGSPKLDERSDVYSLAVTLASLLTGLASRDALCVAASPVRATARSDEPSLLREIDVTLPYFLEDVVLMGTVPERERRTPTCRDFRLDVKWARDQLLRPRLDDPMTRAKEDTRRLDELHERGWAERRRTAGRISVNEWGEAALREFLTHGHSIYSRSDWFANSVDLAKWPTSCDEADAGAMKDWLVRPDNLSFLIAIGLYDRLLRRDVSVVTKRCFADDIHDHLATLLCAAWLRPATDSHGIQETLASWLDAANSPAIQRGFAAYQLGKSRCRRHLELLLATLERDADDEVRAYAAMSIGSIGHEMALAPLMKTVRNETSYRVKEEIADAIRSLTCAVTMS